MLLGWHVDSNICKRLFMLYGEVGDLTDRLFGYHCDHTRQVTPMHRRAAVENSLSEFVDGVSDAGLWGQSENWGCADAEIEDIRLDASSVGRYAANLASTVKRPMTAATEIGYIRETHDKVGYDAAHVLPHLVDVLSSAPRSWNAAWFGGHKAMFELFRAAWLAMGFTGSLLVLKADSDRLIGRKDAAVVIAETPEILRLADVFIVDFADSEGGSLVDPATELVGEDARRLILNFGQIVKAEHARAESGAAPRRVIAINAIHNRFEPLVRGHVEFARSPFSGRLRHGYVLPEQKGPTPWLGLMTLKGAAKRVGSRVSARHRVRGTVITGPHMQLFPGRYTLTLRIEPELPSIPKNWMYLPLSVLGGKLGSEPAPKFDPQPDRSVTDSRRLPASDGGKWKKSGAMAIEIRNGRRVLCRYAQSALGLWFKRRYRFNFSITEKDFESPDLPSLKVRVWSGGQFGFAIQSIDLISRG
jgi:hypothetical protein